MSDDNFDPWKSLAADLGVDASKVPAPPPPPPLTPRATVSSSSSQSPAPKAADWRALAGELGIEVPVEPEQPIRRHDPVADLLGFPPPTSRPPEEDDSRKDRPRHERRSGQFEDRDPEVQSWDDAAPIDAAVHEFDRSESEQFESREEAEDLTNVRERDAEDRPRRRRRRGGRGRGRGRRDEHGDRENRGGGRDRLPQPVDEGQQGSEELSQLQGSTLDPDELRDAQEHAFAEAVEEMEQNRSRYVSTFEHDPDQQRPRRRRGRRGRGRSRERNELPRDDGRNQNESRDRAASDEFETEDELQGGYVRGPAAAKLEPQEDELARTIADVGANGDEDSHHADELHAKSSVRDIVTWKEAIGMIIAGNMEARARNPQQPSGSHGGRGSRGGRGRGRGRGRHSG